MKHLLYIAAFFVMLACKPEAQHQVDVEEELVEMPDDFMPFYDKFHQDTMFQLEHIIFPLSGKPATGKFNIELTDFKWTREGWNIHKAFSEDDDTFDRKFVVHTPELITEVIYNAQYGFYMERRFGNLSDGWHLIYYAEMQQKGE